MLFCEAGIFHACIRVARAPMSKLIADSGIHISEIVKLGGENKENKQLQLSDYLTGQTPKCEGANGGCDRRASSLDNALCWECDRKENYAQFEVALQRSDNRWYLTWEFLSQNPPDTYKLFICRTCDFRYSADVYGTTEPLGVLVPVMACCTNTEVCRRAAAFWGVNNSEPRYRLEDFIALQKAKKSEEA